jgi:hypothetical protein
MIPETDDLGPQREVVNDPPPFLGTWSRVYAFVLVYLAALIFAFWMFTRAFAE